MSRKKENLTGININDLWLVESESRCDSHMELFTNQHDAEQYYIEMRETENKMKHSLFRITDFDESNQALIVLRVLNLADYWKED